MGAIMMTVPTWVSIGLVVIEYAIKVVAIGVVPENRRPSSSQAWLLLILLLPVVGLPLFLLIGSPYVQGRRHQLQAEANAELLARASTLPALPTAYAAPEPMRAAIDLNRALGSMRCVTGSAPGLYPDYRDSIDAMTRAVRDAEREVCFEIYILALDHTTADFFDALTDAVRRGVKVRLLYDHMGSRKYPGFKQMNERLTRDGIDWHQMLPIKPLRGQWRRPDLRNHRKLLVVDDLVAVMGSQNMIDSSYLAPKNLEIGRRWHDVNVELIGTIVHQVKAIFAIDWFTETGQRIEVPIREADEPGDQAMQLLPSGPGFTTEPNLRLFNTLIYRADRRLTIVSPYFIPDESILMAITSAAQRGVDVELFASEQADQFMVHHAQRSYYRALLEAGVRIWLYPKPAVLHTKFLAVDDTVSVIGSSNMDMRSFMLDYEISLMVLGSDFVARLQEIAQQYRDVSRSLDLATWNRRPWPGRYVDNVMRLTSALQ